MHPENSHVTTEYPEGPRAVWSYMSWPCTDPMRSVLFTCLIAIRENGKGQVMCSVIQPLLVPILSREKLGTGFGEDTVCLTVQQALSVSIGTRDDSNGRGIFMGQVCSLQSLIQQIASMGNERLSGNTHGADLILGKETDDSKFPSNTVIMGRQDRLVSSRMALGWTVFNGHFSGSQERPSTGDFTCLNLIQPQIWPPQSQLGKVCRME